MTPTEVAENLQPVSAISIPSPISWADEERDITAWNGNELQSSALDKLYNLTAKVNMCEDQQIMKDWEYLQASDHFYYMATKFFSDGAVHAYFNPYDTPYDAFMNYMNVLSDFEMRLKRFVPDNDEQNEVSKLNNLLKEKELIIDQLTSEIENLKKNIYKRKRASSKSGIKETSYAGNMLLISSSKTKTAKKSKSSKTAKTRKSK
jgi:alpha-amylase